jgi:hypothetical protein
MAEAAKKQIKVLVIGTDHNIQRHQDTVPKLENDRAEFEKLLHRVIKEDKIDLVAEEAGDDTKVWKNLKLQDAFASLVEGSKTVNSPASPIAKTIAKGYGVRYEDVDVDVRVVDESDQKSIEDRSDAMTEKILDVLLNAERVVVIVGELHRKGMVQRLRDKDMSVECLHFP